MPQRHPLLQLGAIPGKVLLMPNRKQWRDGLRRRETPIQDRRANSRIRYSLSCELQVGQENWPGHLVSISLTGALVSSRCERPQHAEVSVAIEVPGTGKRVSLKGRVVRTSRLSLRDEEETCLFGMQFNSVSYESMLLLKALTESNRQGKQQRP